MAKRKTAAERDQEAFYEALREEQYFRSRVPELSNFMEAWDFAQNGPRCGLPGGKLYTNLGYYLDRQQSPDGANPWEKQLHAELGRKIWPTPTKSTSTT